MSAKEKAVEAFAKWWRASTYKDASRESDGELLDAILAAVREDLGMLPKGAAGSEAVGDGTHLLIDDYQRRAENAEARVRELEKELAGIRSDPYRMKWTASMLERDDLETKLADENKRIAELEAEARASAVASVVWSAPIVPNASPEPAATEGDWAEKLALSMWLSPQVAAEFRRIAAEAERRGQVKGLRWAAIHASSDEMRSASRVNPQWDWRRDAIHSTVMAEADRLEREGKGET